jgi:hypothetical protein
VGETKIASMKVKVKEAIINFLKSGNLVLLILGILVAGRLNSFVTPITVLGIRIAPFSSLTIQGIIMPTVIFLLTTILPSLFLVIILTKMYSKSPSYNWFFVGASLTSLWLAMGSLVEVSATLVLIKFSPFPDTYPMPAIYTFELFVELFFSALFGLFGYWIELLTRANKNKPKQNVDTPFIGDDI